MRRTIWNREVIAVVLASVLVLAGCLRREGWNSDCTWPVESGVAIRYTEAHAGPRDQKAAGVGKNHCFGTLLGEIEKRHGRSAAEVFRYFGHRNVAADFVTYLPFALLYGFASERTIRALQRRYPPDDGWVTVSVVGGLTSVAFGTAGLVLGEGWSTMTEMLRIGIGHLSNRSFRLPMARRGTEAFGLAVLLFWGFAVIRYARGERNAR